MTEITETYNDEYELPRETLMDNVSGARLRLTAVTNAASQLLSMLHPLIADLREQIGAVAFAEIADGADIDKLVRNLDIAIRVARGSAEKLPHELFENVADRAAVRMAHDMGLL